MGAEHVRTWEALFEEEKEHAKNLTEGEENLLGKAFESAQRALEQLEKVTEPQPLFTERGVSLLMLAKSARSVRFGVIGIEYGFYDGSYAVLRTALESAQYAALFLEHPERVADWLRCALPAEDSQDRDKLRTALRSDASWAFRRIGDAECRSFLQDQWSQACEAVHSSMAAVSTQYAIDPGAFLPLGIDQLLDLDNPTAAAFDRALAMCALKTRMDTGKASRNPRPYEREVAVMPANLYGHNASLATTQAVLAAYVANGVLQLAEKYYGCGA